MGSKDKKPNKGRDAITIVVLGDDGVGKSSLISTFVSRHFNENIPGIVPRVVLPPDGSGCVTTIVDSQAGDMSLLAVLRGEKEGGDSWSSSMSSSRAGIGGVPLNKIDAVILVYDLNQPNTFFRLENHWLPLLRECFSSIPVILAANKVDLVDGGEQQRIVTLLQRFEFIRQCIKCSARTLLNVNDVFVKAQHAVLYPIRPLYDLASGKLSKKCERALTRIFRMLDSDYDGLLSEEELNAFQSRCLRMGSLFFLERDLRGWKQRDEAKVFMKEGKFTLQGFLVMFDVFITTDHLEKPWMVLRHFGYDDELRLSVPPGLTGSSREILSTSAVRFLVDTFHQFDSDRDGTLSNEDLLSIFSILPSSLPPWHPHRIFSLFQTSFSIPKSSAYTNHHIISSPLPSLSVSPSSSFPTISPTSPPPVGADSLLISTPSPASSTDTPPSSTASASSPLSLNQWMSHWYMIASISPIVTYTELFHLGYLPESQQPQKISIAKKKKRRDVVVPAPHPTKSSAYTSPSKIIRVAVIGNHVCTSTIMHTFCNSKKESAPTEMSEEDQSLLLPETQSTFFSTDEEVTQFVFTQIPKNHLDQFSESLYDTSTEQGFDRIVFGFDADDASSLDFVMEIEQKILTEDVSRMYIAIQSNDSTEVLRKATEHCADLDIEPPLILSTPKILQCIATSPKTKPHAAERKRAAARRRKIMWFGGLVGVSVAVVVGFVMFWGRGRNGGKVGGRTKS